MNPLLRVAPLTVPLTGTQAPRTGAIQHKPLLDSASALGNGTGELENSEGSAWRLHWWAGEEAALCLGMKTLSSLLLFSRLEPLGLSPDSLWTAPFL